MIDIEATYKRLVNSCVSYYLRRKRIFVIAGMRRSGNHAFIGWLLNALEGDAVDLRRLDGVGLSDSGMTLHFNEANYIGARQFMHCIRANKSRIGNAKNVIISLEDYVPRHVDPYIPRSAIRIVILRSTLNLIASRLQKAVNQARNGQDRGDMRIDAKFLSNLRWLYSSIDAGWCPWSYDAWLRREPGYRGRWLSSFGLSFDSSPAISSRGGGSSFSGQERVPSVEEGLKRWTQIDWPNRVMELLSESLDEPFFNDQEREFVRLHLAKQS